MPGSVPIHKIGACLVAISVVATLGGCDAFGRAKYLEKVKEHLLDPGSAHFDHVRIVRIQTKEGSKYVSLCGEVNSKNGMGGYVGNHYFYYIVEHHPSPEALKSDPENKVDRPGNLGEVPMNSRCDFLITYKSHCIPTSDKSDNDSGLVIANDATCSQPVGDDSVPE